MLTIGSRTKVLDIETQEAVTSNSNRMSKIEKYRNNDPKHKGPDDVRYYSPEDTFVYHVNKYQINNDSTKNELEEEKLSDQTYSYQQIYNLIPDDPTIDNFIMMWTIDPRLVRKQKNKNPILTFKIEIINEDYEEEKDINRLTTLPRFNSFNDSERKENIDELHYRLVRDRETDNEEKDKKKNGDEGFLTFGKKKLFIEIGCDGNIVNDSYAYLFEPRIDDGFNDDPVVSGDIPYIHKEKVYRGNINSYKTILVIFENIKLTRKMRESHPIISCVVNKMIDSKDKTLTNQMFQQCLAMKTNNPNTKYGTSNRYNTDNKIIPNTQDARNARNARTNENQMVRKIPIQKPNVSQGSDKSIGQGLKNLMSGFGLKNFASVENYESYNHKETGFCKETDFFIVLIVLIATILIIIYR